MFQSKKGKVAASGGLVRVGGSREFSTSATMDPRIVMSMD